MKHTEGEWFASGTEVVSMPSQVKISNQISGENYEKAKANAKLIAAAPDLLKALSDLYNSIDSCVELTPDVLLKAKQAIKKATS